MKDLEKLKAIILLLNYENECLRSVLSEYDGDKYEYVQMIRADKFRAVIEDLEVKL